MSSEIRTGDDLRTWCREHDIGSPALAEALGMTLGAASNILAGRSWKVQIPEARHAAVDALVGKHNGVDVLGGSPTAEPSHDTLSTFCEAMDCGPDDKVDACELHDRVGIWPHGVPRYDADADGVTPVRDLAAALDAVGWHTPSVCEMALDAAHNRAEAMGKKPVTADTFTAAMDWSDLSGLVPYAQPARLNAHALATGVLAGERTNLAPSAWLDVLLDLAAEPTPKETPEASGPEPEPTLEPAPLDWGLLVPTPEPEPVSEPVDWGLPAPASASEPEPFYRVSFIAHAATHDLEPTDLSWSELLALYDAANVPQGPKDGRGILFGHFAGNIRQKPNVTELDAFVIDGDKRVDLETGECLEGCIPPEQAHAILKAAGVPHLLFTTHSHDPAREYYRWRAVVFPSRPIATEEELIASVRSVWRVLWAAAPVYLSEESLRPAQLWYLPRVAPTRPDTYAAFLDTSAPLWDVDAALEAHRAEVAEAAAASLEAPPSVDIVRGLNRGDDLFGWYNEALGLEGLRDLLMSCGYELRTSGRDTYRLLSPHSNSGSAGVVVYKHHKTGCPLVACHHDSDITLGFKTAYTPTGALAALSFGGDFSRTRSWLVRLQVELEREERLEQMRTDLGEHATAVEEFARLSEVAQAAGWSELKKTTGINLSDLRPIVAELGTLLRGTGQLHRTGLFPEQGADDKAVDFDLVAPVPRLDPAQLWPDGALATDVDAEPVVGVGECHWPAEYLASDRGVYYVPPSEEGEAPPKPIKLASGLEVLGEARSLDSGEDWSLVVRFRDGDGMEHQALVPRSYLFGDSSAFASLLTGAGLWLSNGKGHVLLLMSGLNRVRVRSRMALVRSTGWHEFRGGERAFVLPDWHCGALPEGEGVHWSPAVGTYVNHKFRAMGTLPEWQQQVAALAVGNRIVVLCIAAAFAAPLLRLLNLGSVILHLLGASSKGKTTAMIVGGSVVGGDPHDRLGFGHSWNQTEVGIEENAAAHSDVLLMLDELKQAPVHSVEGIVYAIASGTGRGRGRGQGGLRAMKKWLTLVLSSGEKTLDEFLEAAGRKRADAGTAVRMINIPSVLHRYGVFEELHGFPDGATFAKHLDYVAKTQQFGTALPAFLTHLVNWIAADPQAHIEGIKEQARAWKQAHVPADAGSQIGRIADALAVVAVAGEMATGWGVTGWERGTAAAAVGLVMGNVIAERGTSGDLEIHRGLVDLRSQIETYFQSRFQYIDVNYKKLEGGPSEVTIPWASVGPDGEPTVVSVTTNRVTGERWGWIRRTHDEDKPDSPDELEIILPGDMWRKLTGDKEGRGNPVAHAARARGWLLKGEDERMTCYRKHPDTGKSLRFYVLDAGVMFGDDLEDEA